MNHKHLFTLQLQLFADGGDGAGAAGSGETAAAAVPQGPKRASNPLADVKYGKQSQEAPIADPKPQEVSPAEKNAAFEALIKGEYKEIYDQRVQDTVKRRLKGTQETLDRYAQVAPMLETLGRKYGIKPDDKGNFDLAAIQKAMDEDDSYFEDESMRTGVPVERLREMHRTQRENDDLRRQLSERNSADQAMKLYAGWSEQAEKLKSVYPAFDLRAELQNDKFGELLHAGIDVRTAYEVLHKDEIIPAAMQFTAQKVEQQIAKKVAANAARPSENGNSARAAAVVKSDVSQLTRADRQEIIRRVQRGEKITF